MLHGKMEDHFDEWYENESDLTDHLPPLNMFNEMNLTMRYGVYTDFLNRRGLKINMNNTPAFVEFYIYFDGMTFYIEDVKSLLEAYIKVIKKANTVYNEFYKSK